MSSGTYKQFPTHPISRAKLAPKESAPLEDEDTLVPCEICHGAGLVHPDIAALSRRMLERSKEDE